MKRSDWSSRSTQGLDLRVCIRAGHCQHLIDEDALMVGEFIAQDAAGDRRANVPSTFKLVDLRGQPRQVQCIAEAEIDPRHVDRLELAFAAPAR